MENLVLLEATGGTIALLVFLIYHSRKIKKKLKTHVLRNEEVQKYLKER